MVKSQCAGYTMTLTSSVMKNVILYAMYAYNKKHCSGIYINNIKKGLYVYHLKEFQRFILSKYYLQMLKHKIIIL
jgi:hypothetical protein